MSLFASPQMAEARARQALRAVGLPHRGELERASSTHNEIHLTQQHVVRVSVDLDHQLRREAALYSHLPDEYWAPHLITAGARSGTDYLIVERRRGVPLAHAWPSLTVETRRKTVGQLAAALRSIHETPTPPPETIPPLAKSLYLLDAENTSGGRLDPLVAALETLRLDHNADPGVIDHALQIVLRLRSVLDTDFDRSTLIHGDLTFENILFDHDHITAIVDFEWCAGAPRDLELDVLFRCCAMPSVHVAPTHASRSRAEDYADVPGWFAEDYPELFSNPNLTPRLLLFALAFDVNDLLATGVPRNRSEVSEHHPYNRLIGLVSSGGHVRTFLERTGVLVDV